MKLSLLVAGLVGVAVVAFGVYRSMSKTLPVRMGLAIILFGLVFVGVSCFLLLGKSGAPDLKQAPGYGLHYDNGRLLDHSVTNGTFGAPSYQTDVYGTNEEPAVVVDGLSRSLLSLGYQSQSPTSGPTFTGTQDKLVAQFGYRQWCWRVYELPLPTRYAGVDYSKSDFRHLLAIVLSNDGK